MNHPDLDICKIIGAEFPDSEFVWIDNSAYDGTYYPPCVVKLEDHPGVKFKILSPAPTCEELGEWLYYALVKGLIGHSEAKDIIFSCFGENETQARAEAVKMILTNKGD